MPFWITLDVKEGGNGHTAMQTGLSEIERHFVTAVAIDCAGSPCKTVGAPIGTLKTGLPYPQKSGGSETKRL